MFNKKTVFVIGAGASKEFGLPVGPELIDIIYDMMGQELEASRSGQTLPITRGLIGCGYNMDVTSAIRDFRVGIHTKPSIDQYLHLHRDKIKLVSLGKVSILDSILRAERNSTLNLVDGYIKYRNIKETWLYKLFHLINAGLELNNIDELFKNISFVCFNYDRCIEHFLFTSLVVLTHCSLDEAANAMAGLRIWHPYGSLGPLPFEARPGEAVAFGAYETHMTQLSRLVGNIKIFTEVVDSQISAEIANAMTEAEQVVFLGFGYIEQNLEILSSPLGSLARNVYMTMFGIPKTYWNVHQTAVNGALGRRPDSNRVIDADGLKAGAMIDNYGLLMST